MKKTKHWDLSDRQTLSLFFDTGRWGIQLTFRHGKGFNLAMAEFLCVGLQWYCNTMPFVKTATRAIAKAEDTESICLEDLRHCMNTEKHGADRVMIIVADVLNAKLNLLDLNLRWINRLDAVKNPYGCVGHFSIELAPPVSPPSRRGVQNPKRQLRSLLRRNRALMFAQPHDHLAALDGHAHF